LSSCGSRELFTGVVILLCLGTAWLALGGPLAALGALIAGLVVSESEFSHQATAEILPFRDAFNSVFFISIGMLLRLDFLWEHLPLLAGRHGARRVQNGSDDGGHRAILSLGAGRRDDGAVAGADRRTGLRSGPVCIAAGLMTAQQYEMFVAVAVLTMVAARPDLCRLESELYMARAARGGRGGGERLPARSHVLIVATVSTVKNLAHVLQQTGLPYLILEINPDRWRWPDAGVSRAFTVMPPVGRCCARLVSRRPMWWSWPFPTRGNATDRGADPANESAGADHRPHALRRRNGRSRAPGLRLRWFRRNSRPRWRSLRGSAPPAGAPQCHHLQVELIRKQGYSMLRGLALPRQTLDQLDQILAATTTESFMVPKRSPAAGRSIRDLQLRKMTGATVIAVVRDGQTKHQSVAGFRDAARRYSGDGGQPRQLDQALAAAGVEAEAAAPP